MLNANQKLALFLITTFVIVGANIAVIALTSVRSTDENHASSEPNYPNVFYHTVPTLLGTDDLTVNADLPVRNPWNRGIRVDNIVSSCGCTLAEVREKNIKPLGASVLTVEIKFPPHGGMREVKCVLNLADGENLIHVVSAAAYPLVTIDSDSGVIDLGETLPRSARSSTVNLELRRDRQSSELPRVTSVAAEDDETQSLSFRVFDKATERVSLEPPDITLHTLQLGIDVKPGTEPGVQNATLSIAFEHASAGTGIFKVPIRWYVSQVIAVKPDRAFLSVHPTDSSLVRRTFLLSRLDGGPFEILAAETSVGWATSRRVGNEPREPNSRAVVVEIDPTSVPVRAYCELSVHTDYALQPVIKIPISVALKE